MRSSLCKHNASRCVEVICGVKDTVNSRLKDSAFRGEARDKLQRYMNLMEWPGNFKMVVKLRKTLCKRLYKEPHVLAKDWVSNIKIRLWLFRTLKG
ncbi:hypothetical protein TNIN_8591 [Trichonephila inaurata madagascariensis]|uniref:Uncharacterized protein n=1 Tax=Trichonephila inaurata madagascariensis TaxID=2747483 RepID=A0A8X6XCY4_9ARAC|nr:hypothetical protein TNIN_8591 [Trichonephila inaurata madagascariensis]